MEKSFGIVVDGFGTLGEHFSVYDLSSGSPNLVRRVHGYDTSLGLWYQYATAFMGMKMHEDEYKLLGYEVHVNEDDALRLISDASTYASEWVQAMSKSVYGSKYDPMYDLGALAHTKAKIFVHLTDLCKRYNISDSSKFESRVIIAFYVQAVLENVVLGIASQLGAYNVILSGGVFYNVKLNKMFLEHIKGQVCIYPLAGDQGNAIGLYAMDHPDFMFPTTLNWGKRILSNVGEVKGLEVIDETNALQVVMDKIEDVGYVNLVRGNMEFGPRAMCNTSTLARPTLESVNKINHANDRNTVMPMAPVMTRSMYKELFKYTDRLWKSHAHMVCALEYKNPPMESMFGITHQYNWPYQHSTGRPQTIHDADSFMHCLFGFMPIPLINTSFNFHGLPIALGMESIIKSHMMQHQRDNSFSTVVIRNV
jgi:carbamoyltransferase